VNATEFYGVHMLSGGQDGTICIWDAKRWECLVTLKAHKYTLLYIPPA
jgi:protein MAK11